MLVLRGRKSRWSYFRPGGGGLMKLLAAAVLLLLPALAWLQYSWLEQIADADRERRARTLQTAASQLAQDFDGEVANAVTSLQLEPAVVEQQAWSQFAERYQAWTQRAVAPEIVQAIYFVAAPADHQPRQTPELRVWNAATHSFDVTAWPEELANVRLRFSAGANGTFDIPTPGKRDRGERRFVFPQLPVGDEHSIVLPVMRVVPSEPREGAAPAPPDIRLLGFQIVRLDHAALARDVLPAVVRRHLYDSDGRTDYIAAVVSRHDPSRVIYESVEGAAGIALQSPDAITALLGPRGGSLMFTSRDGRRTRVDVSDNRVPPLAPPPPPTETLQNSVTDRVVVIEARDKEAATQLQRRLVAASEGHWQLAVKHRAGSLEAAVSAARTRNFILSSGILLLLAAAIGLIVVSARRADRLARQQLEFVAAVSHELRTPVSVIGAAAGNLADGVVEEPGRVKKYGVTIQTEARRLAETVERVLQLAGMAAGRDASSSAVIPAHTLIRDALQAVRHEVETSGVTLELQLADSLPPVTGDALALRTALQNLIGNAVKYSGAARWVRVSADVIPGGFKTAVGPGAALRIVVQDRGIGIDTVDRRHIFEPFYRGREAVALQIQGSGLGLHLVARIIEAHGGVIRVESEAGRGSTFTIELPVAPDTPATEGSSAHAFGASPAR